MQQLGKNIGGYRGEQIDIQNVLHQIEETIAQKNWIRDSVKLSSPDGKSETDFIAFRRLVPAAQSNLSFGRDSL